MPPTLSAPSSDGPQNKAGPQKRTSTEDARAALLAYFKDEIRLLSEIADLVDEAKLYDRPFRAYCFRRLARHKRKCERLIQSFTTQAEILA